MIIIKLQQTAEQFVTMKYEKMKDYRPVDRATKYKVLPDDKCVGEFLVKSNEFERATISYWDFEEIKAEIQRAECECEKMVKKMEINKTASKYFFGFDNIDVKTMKNREMIHCCTEH